jgi:hypothetical protein
MILVAGAGSCGDSSPCSSDCTDRINTDLTVLESLRQLRYALAVCALNGYVAQLSSLVLDDARAIGEIAWTTLTTTNHQRMICESCLSLVDLHARVGFKLFYLSQRSLASFSKLCDHPANNDDIHCHREGSVEDSSCVFRSSD